MCLIPVAVVAFIWQCFSLPDMDSNKAPQSRGSVFTLLSRPIIVIGMLACGLFFMGQFALFTYIRPFLETVTQVETSGLSWILFIIGIAGFIGTLVITSFLNTGFYQTLIAIPLMMAAIAGMLILSGQSIWIVTLLFGFWGMLATAAPTGWWTWIARILPEDAEAGGGLMVAVIQLSIALGSTAGGLVFDNFGWQTTFGMSAVLLFSAVVLTFITSRQSNSIG